MPSTILLRQDQGGVTTITLNRPSARNALSLDLMAALEAELDAIEADEATRVVVIAAAGPAFCAGHDLREVRGMEPGAAHRALFAACSRLMLRITSLRCPVIAQVHGIATAAGCQLVATCDLAVAAETARFATPGVNIGLFCSTPMVALTRAVGRKAAMEMLLTGDLADAGEAKRLGLVNRVVPDAELAAATARAGRQHRREKPQNDRNRQAGLLPPGGNGSGRGLRIHFRRDGAKYGDGGCGGGNRRLPAKARASVDRCLDMVGKGG